MSACTCTSGALNSLIHLQHITSQPGLPLQHHTVQTVPTSHNACMPVHWLPAVTRAWLQPTRKGKPQTVNSIRQPALVASVQAARPESRAERQNRGDEVTSQRGLHVCQRSADA